jgi:hypothetical protein
MGVVFLKKKMKKFMKRRAKLLQQNPALPICEYSLARNTKNYLYDLKFRFSRANLHSRTAYIKKIFKKKKFVFFKYFIRKIPHILFKLNLKSKQKNCFIIPQLNINSKV